MTLEPSMKERASCRISRDSEICSGGPHIRGNRMHVSDIVSMIAAAADRSEIPEGYPYLQVEDISAALEFAAQAVDHRAIQAA